MHLFPFFRILHVSRSFVCLWSLIVPVALLLFPVVVENVAMVVIVVGLMCTSFCIRTKQRHSFDMIIIVAWVIVNKMVIPWMGGYKLEQFIALVCPFTTFPHDFPFIILYSQQATPCYSKIYRWVSTQRTHCKFKREGNEDDGGGRRAEVSIIIILFLHNCSLFFVWTSVLKNTMVIIQQKNISFNSPPRMLYLWYDNDV